MAQEFGYNYSPGTYAAGNTSYDFAPGTYIAGPRGYALGGGVSANNAGVGAKVNPYEVQFNPADWSYIDYNSDPSRGMGEFQKGLYRGGNQTQAILYGGAAAIADILGFDSIRDWGIEGYNRNMEEASQYPAATDRLEDINGVGSAIDWATGKTGELIPTMVSALLSGGVGSAIAKTVGAKVLRGYAAKQVSKYAAENVAKGMAADIALTAATKRMQAEMIRAGSTAAVVGYTSLAEGGGNYGKDVTAHGVEGTSPAMDMMFGFVSGIAEGIMGAEVSFLRAATGRVASDAAETSFRKILVQALPKAMMKEGGTEAFQEIASAINANIQDARGLITADDISDIVNAAAAGALGGAGMHPATAYFESRNSTKKDNTRSVADGAQDVTASTNSLNDIPDAASVVKEVQDELHPWDVAREQEDDYLRQWEDYSRQEVENFNSMFNKKEQDILKKFDKFVKSGTIQQGESIASIQQRIPEMPQKDAASVGRIIAEYSSLQKDKSEKRKALEARIDKGFRAQDGKLITAAYKQSIQNRRAQQQMDESTGGALQATLTDAVTYAQKVSQALDSRINTINQSIEELMSRQQADEKNLTLTADKSIRYKKELEHLQKLRTNAIYSKRKISKSIGDIVRKAQSPQQLSLGTLGVDIQELRNTGDSALELQRTRDIFRDSQLTRVEEAHDKYTQLLDSLKKSQARVDSITNEYNADQARAVKNQLTNTRNTLASVDLYRDMPLMPAREESANEDDVIKHRIKDDNNKQFLRDSLKSVRDSNIQDAVRRNNAAVHEAKVQQLKNATGQKNVSTSTQSNQQSISDNSTAQANTEQVIKSAEQSEIQATQEQQTNQSVATAVRKYTGQEQKLVADVVKFINNTLNTLPTLKDKVTVCVDDTDSVLPIEIRNSIKDARLQSSSKNKDFSVKGTYWNGRVYLIASNIKSKQDAVRTLMHEGVAHFGLRSIMTNDQLSKFLNLVFNNFKGTQEWKNFISTRPEYLRKVNKPGDKVTQAEEFVAYVAEQKRLSDLLRRKPQSVFNRIVYFLRGVLSSLGLKSEVKMKDIDDVLALSAQHLAGMQNGNVDAIKQIEVLLGKVDPVQDSRVLLQTAFHGTPHNFDQFTLDHIGSGEGAQAHGWGLYFAQDRKVSEEYRNKLARRNTNLQVSLGNKIYTYDRNIRKFIREDGSSVDYTSLEGSILSEFKLKKFNKIDYIQQLQSKLADNTRILEKTQSEIAELGSKVPEYTTAILRTAVNNIRYCTERLEFLQKNEIKKLDSQQAGSLFEVDIPENDVLLDEQKKFKDQPSFVQDALSKLQKELNFNFTENTTGRHIYYNIMSALQKKGIRNNILAESASKLLNSVGIKGITYLGVTDGRCFVVFDDSAIKILNKIEDAANSNILYSAEEIPVSNELIYGTKFDTAESSHEYYKKLEGARSGNTNTPYILNLPKNSNTLNLNDSLVQQPERVQARLSKLLTAFNVQPNIVPGDNGTVSVTVLNTPVVTGVTQDQAQQYIQSNQFMNDLTGWDVYNFLSTVTNSKREASKILSDFGIRGAQYIKGEANNYYLFEGNDLSTVPYEYNTEILSEPKFLVTEETPADEITVDPVTGEPTTKDTADGNTYMNTLFSEVNSQRSALQILKDVLRTGKHKDADGNLVAHSLYEQFRERADDQYRRLYVIQNYLKKKFPGIINGVTNVYQRLTGLVNRIRGQQVQYRNQFFRPAIEAMQKIDAPIPVYDDKGNLVKTYTREDSKYDDFLLAMVDDVLIARHAAERNKSVASRMRGVYYPIKDKDGNIVGHGHKNKKTHSESSTILNASGMTDEQAATILSRYGNFPGLSKVLDYVDNMNRFTLNLMRNNGLITEEAYQRMSEYEFYVPLQGWQENIERLSPVWFRERSNKSLSTGNKKVVNYAKGRGGLPISPFIRSVQQMDDIIAVAEQNDLMRKFGELVKAVNKEGDKSIFEFDNKNPESVRLQVLPDGTIGFVTKTSEFQGSGEKGVTYIDEGGEVKRIVIHDKWLANAMTGNNRAPVSAYINTMRKYTGIFSQLLTSRNPAFAIVNPVRDLPSAVINLGSSIEENVKRGLLEETETIQKGVVKDVMSGKMARILWDISAADTLGKKFDPSKYDPQLVEDLNDWRTYGGHTKSIDAFTVEELSKDVRESLRKKSGARATIEKAKNYMDMLSDTTENMTRLAVYSNFMKAFKKNLDQRAKAEGWDNAKYQYELDIAKQKSVNISLECTVNFTKKGAAANLYNPLWAFSSASIQSFARIARNLWRPTSTPQENFKRVSKFIAGGVAFPLIWNAITRAWMGDDDDGINKYDKIPEYIRYNHLIIPMPFGDGGYVKIPLPYGYNVFTAAGNIIDSIAHKTTTVGNGAFELMKIALAGVSPIDPSEQGIVAFVPTLFKPIAEVAANVNFTGAPIMPSGPGTENTPDYLKAWASTPQGFKDAAALLNFITGGFATKDGVGLLDISPETIEHLTMSYTGGIGRIVKQAITLATSPVFGTEVGLQDVPVLNRLVGTTTYQNNNALYNRYNDQIMQARALMKSAEGNSSRTRELRDNFRNALSLEKAAQDATNQLNKLKQAERALRKQYPSGTRSAKFNARMELIQKQKEQIMKRFNRLANNAGLTMD